MADFRNLWRKAGPNRTLMLAAVLICLWSVLLISTVDDQTVSGALLAVSAVAAVAAGAAWISIRWRQAERRDRLRRRRPFSLD